ncbi:Crp/Fnr family transcriptional regulator [Micromonospora arida]|uniref:Crp/Fnr family transcriptional regulator n=1 Tax=Micromonospora arida TaxID=2203715 RepID=UPI0013152ED2|nr:Crp/Fnr family transcriptional regulator [Micromonospora arida]
MTIDRRSTSAPTLATEAGSGFDLPGIGPPTAFLSRLSREQVRSIDQLLTSRRRYRPGDRVFFQGEACGSALLVRNGRLRLTLSATNGYEMLVDLCGPGDIAGYGEMFLDSERQVTATADGDTVLQLLPYADLRRLIDQQPAIGRELHRHTLIRLDASRTVGLANGAYSADARVAQTLIDIDRRFGFLQPDRTSRLDGINQKDIAGITAASRETVARVLRRLRKLHVVKTGRNSVIILNHALLTSIASDSDSTATNKWGHRQPRE